MATTANVRAVGTSTTSCHRDQKGKLCEVKGHARLEGGRQDTPSGGLGGRLRAPSPLLSVGVWVPQATNPSTASPCAAHRRIRAVGHEGTEKG